MVNCWEHCEGLDFLQLSRRREWDPADCPTGHLLSWHFRQHQFSKSKKKRIRYSYDEFLPPTTVRTDNPSPYIKITSLTGFMLNRGYCGKDTGFNPGNIGYGTTQSNFYLSIRCRKLHSVIWEWYWECNVKDSVGKETIQVAHHIFILPPCGYFTTLVSQFSMGCLHSSVNICTKGSIKITLRALSMAFCLVFQPK